MLTTLMPFICMAIGLIIGFQKLPQKAYKVVDIVTTVALIVLMVTIGGNVGTNEEVINSIGTVGFNCILTCILAIAGSVGLCLIIEKTVLPLGKYETSSINDGAEEGDKEGAKESYKRRIDPILIIIPISVVLGAVLCYFFMDDNSTYILDYTLWISLVVLYTSVGIGMGQNKGVFGYIKKVGFKVLFIVLGVYFGSIAGGAIASVITGMPLKYALISASGVGYYSMTGATMLQQFGAEAGVYGFMVNVFRDLFTVLLLPILGRISKSAPIASGAAGNMDTMLVPITKVVGQELGLIALIVGVILTFGVPVVLPLLCSLLG